MKQYVVKVVMSYWQTTVIEANSIEEAKDMAFGAFDITQAVKGDGEVHSAEEIKGESK